MEEIQVDTPLQKVLELGKVCNRCNNCCKYGSGFLIGDDTKKIAKLLNISEDELKLKYLDEKELFNKKLFRPKLKSKQNRPYGECVFFNNGCTIQEGKPLQCKIGNCGEHGENLSTWFMLNYVVDKNDAESIRQYAVYIKSGGKVIAGGKLEELIPDKLKLQKILSYEILK